MYILFHPKGFIDRYWAVNCFREIGISYSDLLENYVSLSRKLHNHDLAQIANSAGQMIINWIQFASRWN
jgi:hypothetical protein